MGAHSSLTISRAVAEALYLCACEEDLIKHPRDLSDEDLSSEIRQPYYDSLYNFMIYEEDEDCIKDFSDLPLCVLKDIGGEKG